MSKDYLKRITERMRHLIEELGLDVPTALIVTEEFAREVGERVGEAVERVKPERLVSRILDRKNWSINAPTELVSSNRRGRLKELTMMSNSNRFDLFIQTDNVVRLYRSYSDLASLSPFSEYIDAFEEDGTYVVRIGELNWLANCIISIYPHRGQSITLTRVFGKYDEYV